MLQKRREEIEVIREEQGERRLQRGKRVEKLKAEHEKSRKARAVELKTAKKMMQKNQFKAFEKVSKTLVCFVCVCVLWGCSASLLLSQRINVDIQNITTVNE
jgi:hypothetical protein